MRLATKRKTTAIGDQDGDKYANYISIESSVDDLLNWLAWHKFDIKKNYSVSQYVNFLKDKKYFEAPVIDYINAVNSWI